MSVSLTEDAVRARTKTVTRRLGWRMLKPGDRLTLCRKVMGRKPGEPLVRIAEVEVIDVRREPLRAITMGDVVREGFGDVYYTPAWFVDYFCQHMKVGPDTEVTRIEWRYVDEPMHSGPGLRGCPRCGRINGHDHDVTTFVTVNPVSPIP